jgi:hypothetical protein
MCQLQAAIIVDGFRDISFESRKKTLTLNPLKLSHGHYNSLTLEIDDFGIINDKYPAVLFTMGFS